MKIRREQHRFVVKEGDRGPYITIEPLGGRARVLNIYPPADTPIQRVQSIAAELTNWTLGFPQR